MQGKDDPQARNKWPDEMVRGAEIAPRSCRGRAFSVGISVHYSFSGAGDHSPNSLSIILCQFH